MLENEIYFKNLLFQQAPYLSFEKLIEDNANNDVWGTNFSIIALSFLVKRPIISYTASINSCIYTNPFNYPSSPIKVILHNNHFSAILPLNICNNYGDVPLYRNELIIRNSVKRTFDTKIDSVYEVLD